MRHILTCAAVCALAATAAAAGEVSFSAKPTANKDGDKVKIAFAVAGPTDVEVAVLSADGKVVRHLAAGVLGGKNPPPAPLKAGLSQTLEWDGKDDFGKPAAGGPWKVRVRAGTGAKFGRFIGEDPYTFGAFESIAADEDGNVYINTASVGDYFNQHARNLRVFDAEGRYLRTLLPFPADLPPEGMKDVATWDGTLKTWHPRNHHPGNPTFYAEGSLVSASKQGGLIFAHREGMTRLDFRGAVPGKAFATGQKPWPADRNDSTGLAYGGGATYYAASPDGKCLYMCGPYGDRTKFGGGKVEPGVIWRMKLDGADTMKRFSSIPAEPRDAWAPEGKYINSPGAATPANGMAVDAQGRLYVCDRAKDRVVAFDADGKEVGEFAVKSPAQVAVHPKTGAVYVLRQRKSGYAHGAAVCETILEKYPRLEKGAAPAASFRFHDQTNSPKMALSVRGEKTTIWVVGADTAENNARKYVNGSCTGLVAVDDAGAALRALKTAFAPKEGVQNAFNRSWVDSERDEIYASDGVTRVWRYSGLTGTGGMLRKDGRPFTVMEMAVGGDGYLYARTGDPIKGPVERLTRDLEPVPYPETGSNRLYETYSRFGIGYCEKGLAAGRDGRVYDMWMYDWEKYFVSGWGSDGKALKGKYLADKMKGSGPVWKDVKLPDDRKLESAIIGPANRIGGGLEVDLAGNIYLGMGSLPEDYEPYPGFSKDQGTGPFGRQAAVAVGTVVKFRPEGGAVIGGGVADAESKDPGAPRLKLAGGITVEGGLVAYPGVGPYGGSGPSCCCRAARFDVDRYGRVAAPNGMCNWAVLYDNAGNEILKFGGYGNFDSQFVPPDSKDKKPVVAAPEIPLGWPTGAGWGAKCVYVNDTYNRRIVRADLTWQAEETCEVK